jgi:transcriptional regulator with XRE-family HTH domain
MSKIDATIGQSIRHYRWLQGIDQSELAAALGISVVQLRSHEAGKSRVTAARLFAISAHLGVDVSVFFQRGASLAQSSASPNMPDAAAPPARKAPAAPQDSVANGKYLAVLMTHFQRLNDAQKQAVLHLVLSISKETLAPLEQKPLAFAGGDKAGTRNGTG